MWCSRRPRGSCRAAGAYEASLPNAPRHRRPTSRGTPASPCYRPAHARASRDSRRTHRSHPRPPDSRARRVRPPDDRRRSSTPGSLPISGSCMRVSRSSPDAPREDRRHPLRARERGEPHVEGGRRRHPGLCDRHVAGRHRAGSVDLRALDRLPLGRRPGGGASGRGPRGEARGPPRVQRTGAPRALGRLPPTERAGAEGHEHPLGCRSPRRARRSAPARPRTPTRPTARSTYGRATSP